MWEGHASKVQGTSTFQIKILKGKHVCGREYNNKHVTSRYLSQRYQFKIRNDPKFNLIGFQNEVKRDLMVNVISSKLYRAKRKAREDIQGLNMEQYHNLWHYAAMIVEYNPGSIAKFKLTNLMQHLEIYLKEFTSVFMLASRDFLADVDQLLV